MTKLDLKKDLKHLYNPPAKVITEVDVPPMNFLMVDGRGDPNVAPEYAQTIEALYAVAYALKFKVKKSRDGVDFAVMPLEGLWWAEDMTRFDIRDKGAWQWTMMIMQPQPVTAALFAATLPEVVEKKKLSALSRVRFEPYAEGRAAQIQYVGPYADEGPTIARLHAHIRESGHALSGKHHEIYLGDPRKTAPEKLRTVIRQPFR
jgi:hypothetical protein